VIKVCIKGAISVKPGDEVSVYLVNRGKPAPDQDLRRRACTAMERTRLSGKFFALGSKPVSRLPSGFPFEKVLVYSIVLYYVM
jgi:hypothetical protein